MSSPSRPPAVDARLLETLEREFHRVAGADARIDVADLQRALGLGSEYLAGRVLTLLDADGDGVVTRDEFLAGVRKLVFGTDREKLLFAFKMHDHDGDGAIQLDELHRMIAISLAESDVQTRASQPADVLAQALMHAADRNGNGRISFDELEAVVAQRPDVLRTMTRTEALWIAPNEELVARFSAPSSPVEKARRRLRFLENRWAPAAWLALLSVANVALFVATWLSRPGDVRSGLAVQLGRATAACMDLDGALILVPVLRRLLTRVRASALGRVVPVDDMIDFHKLAGHALFALSLVHAGAFVAAYAQGHPSVLGLPLSVRGATGLALVLVFGVMWLGALRFVRRTKHFEVFYVTHLLYVAWLALALVHAPGFVPWVGLPLAGLGVELLARRLRRGRRTTVARATALRSGVTRLDIARPRGFTLGAGDYVFVRVPAVARWEWHPFTVSSAPEREDVLTLHVRSLGNWTSALRRLVEAREARGDEAPLEAYVDGPYGSPSAAIFRSRFAVLVGAGIGVTPFASVLESLVRREADAGGVALEKAHFFWLSRDQYAFEWFTDLLADVEARDTRGLLDLHLWMTDGRSDLTTIALRMAREVSHAWGRPDAITGLRAMTHLGAPDLRAELAKIAAAHAPEKVDVYFCGPPGLGTKLRRACRELGMPYREERF